MRHLYEQLRQHDSAAWQRALDAVVPTIHEIDRNATRIWFAFWPLDLCRALEAADDPSALGRKFGLMGNWRLADQIDQSHRFLYAHRYWPQVKNSVAAEREWPDDLAAAALAVAEGAARMTRTDREVLLGMSLVALMTLRQVGPEAMAAAPGTIHLSVEARRRSPHQVMSRRGRDDWQGVFGFLRGMKKMWTVTFDENDPSARFRAIHGQEIATAAQADKREYKSRDHRCTPGEGPIPVECRAASCGTCWVGVLSGAEKLSPVVDRDESRRMKVFGYQTSQDAKPLIRLACQAKALGAVSIVIPPWNGVFGDKLHTQ